MKTQYITLEDFFEYSGENLEAEIKSDDNPSRTAEAFLRRIEIRMEAFLSANFHINIDEQFKRFSDYQKLHYKYALLEQAIYVFRNSEISTDSGYDADKGIITSRGQIDQIKISPNAKEQLQLCGLWCRKFKGIRGGFGGWYI
jgi:hypothetical protein